MTEASNRFDHRWPRAPQDHCVVVLGASSKPARYSNQAVRLLKAHDYHVIPVHAKIAEIENIPVAHNLRTIKQTVHTLTLYVGPERSRALINDIVHLNPTRVIFNPGSDSEELQERLHRHHIACIHGCTLVMLRTGQFL